MWEVREYIYEFGFMSRESGVHLSRAPTPLSISLFIRFFFFYWFLLCCLLHSSHSSFLFLIFSPLPYACISLVYTHISLYASLLVTLFPNSFCQRERDRDREIVVLSTWPKVPRSCCVNASYLRDPCLNTTHMVGGLAVWRKISVTHSSLWLLSCTRSNRIHISSVTIHVLG